MILFRGGVFSMNTSINPIGHILKSTFQRRSIFISLLCFGLSSDTNNFQMFFSSLFFLFRISIKRLIMNASHSHLEWWKKCFLLIDFQLTKAFNFRFIKQAKRFCVFFSFLLNCFWMHVCLHAFRVYLLFVVDVFSWSSIVMLGGFFFAFESRLRGS
jgi:hypothetical protein